MSYARYLMETYFSTEEFDEGVLDYLTKAGREKLQKEKEAEEDSWFKDDEVHPEDQNDKYQQGLHRKPGVELEVSPSVNATAKNNLDGFISTWKNRLTMPKKIDRVLKAYHRRTGKDGGWKISKENRGRYFGTEDKTGEKKIFPEPSRTVTVGGVSSRDGRNIGRALKNAFRQQAVEVRDFNPRQGKSGKVKSHQVTHYVSEHLIS